MQAINKNYSHYFAIPTIHRGSFLLPPTSCTTFPSIYIIKNM